MIYTSSPFAHFPFAAAAAAAPVFKGDLLNDSYYPTGADADNSNKKWYIIDAEGQTLGRLACLAATYVRGKHLPTYTPSMDMGAFVIVINAEKVKVTGNKAQQKTYFQHLNGRPGSYRIENFQTLQQVRAAAAARVALCCSELVSHTNRPENKRHFQKSHKPVRGHTRYYAA